MCNLAPGRASAETRMQGPLDADAFLQLAADDGLYSNVAALLTGPQDQLMRAAPDASFGWSPCTYTLATSEGSWPTSISTVVPCVDMYAVAQQCRTGYAHRPPAHRTRRRAARPEGGHRPWFATVRVPASGVPCLPHTVAPQAPLISVGMDRLPLATASGWSWHKNHQLPRLTVTCGAAAPLEP